MRLCLVVAALSLTLAARAQVVEPGISRALALERAARVSDVRYALRFDLTSHAATTAASETVSFSDSGRGDLAIDFRDGTIQSATLNRQPIATDTPNGHLMLPAAMLKKTNELEVKFTANIAAAGKAITRYTDKDDGNEYVYTLFVPMDADMAFPCFDQPDLKGRFTLALGHPTAWATIANTAATSVTHSGTISESRFAETRPISTYLFAFAAGPFQKIASLNPAEPAIYVRKSQLAKAQVEAPAVQKITARGIAYLSDYFQQPFPFPKYDLVLIPGFPFGGMEHAGATFLNEDGVLFRSTPTQSDYFRRDTLVLHETTHQWFGDLVTMRWFDDLWLKEGFAQYMAYKALAALEPQTQPWKHFYEDIKPLAYGIDETQGTTPIFQNIPNLKDAKSAYGAIVYQKAPAVLKQLNFKLGDEAFRGGLRVYLKEHAYANATWPDLIHAFEQAGGKDVQAWADAWIVRRGMPQVDVAFACEQGMLKRLTLTQQDVLTDGFTWPIANDLRLVYAQGSARDHQTDHQTLRVDWNGASYDVASAVGGPCPAYVWANDGDEAYGRFLLDGVSEGVVRKSLAAGGQTADELHGLFHSMMWGALWDNVHVARTAPRSYVELAVKTLAGEPDESIGRVQGGRMAVSLHNYMSAKSREAETPAAEAAVRARMLGAPTLGLRIVNFRTFTGIAATPAGLGTLKDLLSGKVAIDGLVLKPLDRWNVLGHLVAVGDPEAGALVAAEQKRDSSGEAQKYAYGALAGVPVAAAKARYFAEYRQVGGRQEDWLSQSLRPFNSWNQQGLTEPYLQRALDELPEIKKDRKIFFLGAWIGAFVDGQSTASAQAVVHAWLGQAGIDPDLRLKVLEASDGLDRTVIIRARFPE